MNEGVRIADDKDREMPISSGIMFGEWQLCPKCHGQGTVSKPPHTPGDVFEWSSTSTTFLCDVCEGSKILPKPIINK